MHLINLCVEIDYDGVISHGLHLRDHQVKNVTCDFEAVVWQSIRGLLPNIRLVGCRFQYTQALLRFILGIGLQQACYSNNLLSYYKSCSVNKHKSEYKSYLSIYVH